MVATPAGLRRPGLLLGATAICGLVYLTTLVMHGLPAARMGPARVAYLALYCLTAFAAWRAAAMMPSCPADASRQTIARRRGRVVAWRATAVYAASVPSAALLAQLFGAAGVGTLGSAIRQLVAMLVYPAAVVALMALVPRRGSRGERVQLGFDLALVVISALVLAGFFYLHQTGAGLISPTRSSFLYFVLSPIGALAVVFAVTRLVFGRDDLLSDTAILLLVAGILTSTASDLSAWVPGVTIPGLTAGLWACAMLIVSAAAYAELRSAPVFTAREPDARAPGYSLLPFGMAAMVLLVLLASVPLLRSSATRFLLYGVIMVGILVLARQLVTLHEVRRLLARQRRQDARFRALVERSGDALVIVAPNGHVTYHSPAFEQIFAVAECTGQGRDLYALIEPDEHPSLRKLLTTRADTAGEEAAATATATAITVRTRAATPHWIELVASDHTGDPDIAGVVLNVRDVTERRHLQVRLSQAEKLEAVGRLAGGIAHDFNNMLTAILGYTDLVEQGLSEGNPDVEDIREIRRASLRAAELTRQLMAFGRRQMIAPRHLTIDDVVGGMERMLRRLMPEPTVLSTQLDSAGWLVLADPAQIEQVVLNLALNGRDAMPHGGRLTIETTRVAFRDGGQPRIGGGDAGGGDARDAAGGRYVRLRVSDAGEGMSPATMHRLFEPFFTTKTESAGTGLGLATVYGIVKQAGGYIGVDSTVGSGTTFTVLLPCAGKADTHESSPACERIATESLSTALR